jgi:hypothetical protein
MSNGDDWNGQKADLKSVGVVGCPSKIVRRKFEAVLIRVCIMTDLRVRDDWDMVKTVPLNSNIVRYNLLIRPNKYEALT